MATTAVATGKSLLVSPSWVASKIPCGASRAGDLVVLDGSWAMPASGRDTRTEFIQKRLPTARFFGIDEIKDHNTDLPHMLPTAEEFATAVAKLGVRPESHIVVYDSAGAFSACRVYWMFRAFNHLGQLSILDGGLPAWVREGHAVASGPEDGVKTVPAEDLRRIYKLNRDLVRTYDQVVRNISTRSEQVVDARSAGRFSGAEPDPRQGLPSGHIPGALSVPYGSVLLNPGSPDGSKFRNQRDIEHVFKESGVDMSKPVITSCGSGITASVLYVALELAGAKGPVSVYDGSWTEYAGMPGSAIAKT